MIGPNATYLFNNVGGVWPANGEQFWTSLFALYLMHLSHQANPTLRVWRANGKSKKYELRIPKGERLLSPIHFSDVAIEASIGEVTWPSGDSIPPELGMKPDILVKYRENEQHRYLIIENKVRDSNELDSSQALNYSNLAIWLRDRQIPFDILVLQSIGNARLFGQVSEPLGDIRPDEFGLLLWEDAIASMARIGFAPMGLPIQDWLPYTEDMRIECDER